MDNLPNMKEIPGFPRYFAGDDGAIYSRHYSCDAQVVRKLIPSKVANGNYHVTLSRDGKCFTRGVGRLVCEAFHGPCPDGMECCHGPNGRDDNRPNNVSWGTRRKNIGEDRLRDGTDNRGEKHGQSKLTQDDVLLIRALAGTLSTSVLAKQFCVSKQEILQIIQKKRWGWL